jgi:HAE1 family hydrophobic/amphiphilic exporter-1
MTSRSRTGQAEVTLEFAVGTDMGDILLLVSNRLDRVGGYPDEAGEPTLNTSGSDDSPIAWVMVTRGRGQHAPMPPMAISSKTRSRSAGADRRRFHRERFGGVSRELQIVIDPDELARFNLTIPEVVAQPAVGEHQSSRPARSTRASAAMSCAPRAS